MDMQPDIAQTEAGKDLSGRGKTGDKEVFEGFKGAAKLSGLFPELFIRFFGGLFGSGAAFGGRRFWRLFFFAFIERPYLNQQRPCSTFFSAK